MSPPVRTRFTLPTHSISRRSRLDRDEIAQQHPCVDRQGSSIPSIQSVLEKQLLTSEDGRGRRRFPRDGTQPCLFIVPVVLLLLASPAGSQSALLTASKTGRTLKSLFPASPGSTPTSASSAERRSLKSFVARKRLKSLQEKESVHAPVDSKKKVEPPAKRGSVKAPDQKDKFKSPDTRGSVTVPVRKEKIKAPDTRGSVQPSKPPAPSKGVSRGSEAVNATDVRDCVLPFQKCDFAFKGSLVIVPFYFLFSMRPSLPFSDSLLYYNAVTKTTAPVIGGTLTPKCKMKNGKKAGPCPSFGLVNRGGTKLTVQGAAPGLQYAGSCFVVTFDALMMKMGMGRNNIVKLTANDNNSQFPEKRRCAVFRVV